MLRIRTIHTSEHRRTQPKLRTKATGRPFSHTLSISPRVSARRITPRARTKGPRASAGRKYAARRPAKSRCYFIRGDPASAGALIPAFARRLTDSKLAGGARVRGRDPGRVREDEGSRASCAQPRRLWYPGRARASIVQRAAGLGCRQQSQPDAAARLDRTSPRRGLGGTSAGGGRLSTARVPDGLGCG